MSVNRRHFLRTGAAASVAFAAPAIHGAAKTKKYRTALIGCGWWGMNILRTALAEGRSDAVALCDVDRSALDKAADEIDDSTGKTPKKYKDFREMLEQQKPEIVIVGTPDHWHPLQTIAACNAGAHVFVEKPVGHTVLEGRAMVQAARGNDRIVQVGTHRRVSHHNQWAMDFLREGKLGRVNMLRAFVHSGGGPGSPTPDQDPPEGLDWDMWCGPAPLRPFNPAIHPRGFRHFMDFANGTLGDWGIHWMDQILWWSEEQWPKSVSSTGAKWFRQDNADAPDTQVAHFEFDSFTAVWEHRRYAANHAEKHRVGIYFYGQEGTLHIGWQEGSTFYPANGRDPVNVPARLHQPDAQNIPELWTDFLQCIQTGQQPVCDIEHGHRATTLSLLGVLSMNLGRSIRWDGQKAQVIDDDEANRLLRREYREPWQYPI